MADEATPDDGSGSPMGGLGAMRLMMSGMPMAGQSQIDQLASGPVMDPSTKWLRAAAAAIAPTRGGGFNESLSNSLNAYADTTDKESELRAKYLPIVAQALLQRQQMQYAQANAMYKLSNEWDGALTGSLTGLLSTPGGVTPQNVMSTISSQVQSGKVPPQVAQQFLQNLPKDPSELHDYILHKSISNMSADSRVKAVSPDVEMANTQDGLTPVNKNPNSGNTPLGAMPGTLPMGLKPEDPIKIEDTPQGKRIISTLTGKAAFVGTPEAQQVIAESRAMLARQQAAPPVAGGQQPPPSGPGMIPGQPAPGGPGPAPMIAQAGGPPPGGPGPAPTGSSTQIDPAMEKAKLGYADEFTKYRSGLDDKVASLQDMNDRIGQMRQYMSQFRTGATAEVRGKLAAMAKDVTMNLGMSADQSTALANRIQGGDLAAAQAFQKLSVQGAMEALKGAMQTGTGASAGRVTQAEFQIFVKNNPNLDTDPRAIEKVHNFVAEQYRKALGEQSYVSDAFSTGTPLDKIRSSYAQSQGRGLAPPRLVTGNAMGTTGPNTNIPIGLDMGGKKMQQNPKTGLWEYQE